MTFSLSFASPVRNWRAAWRDVILSAVAAGLSWWLASRILGNAQPVFAPIAAVIGLSPGVASRRRQTLGMLVGVLVGISVGTLAAGLAPPPVAGVALSTLAAMLLASSFGLTAVMVIQAGASALVVIGAGLPDAGWSRMLDASVGAAVALLFSQVFFSGDPRRMLVRVGGDMLALADRLSGLPPEQREAETHNALDAAARLADALKLVADARRWTLAGHAHRRRLLAAETAWRAAGLPLAAALLQSCAASTGAQSAAVGEEAAAAVRALLEADER